MRRLHCRFCNTAWILPRERSRSKRRPHVVSGRKYAWQSLASVSLHVAVLIKIHCNFMTLGSQNTGNLIVGLEFAEVAAGRDRQQVLESLISSPARACGHRSLHFLDLRCRQTTTFQRRFKIQDLAQHTHTTGCASASGAMRNEPQSSSSLVNVDMRKKCSIPWTRS